MSERDARPPASYDIAGEDFLFHLYRGSELLQDNRVHDAKAELEQALSLQPSDPKGQDLLGIVYFRLGLYPRAITIYERLIQAHPEAIEPRINLALSYLKTGQPAQARVELEKVVEQSPRHTRAWGYLGLAFQRMGDYERASHAFAAGGHDAMARRVGDLATTPNAMSLRPEPMRAEMQRAAGEAFQEIDRAEGGFRSDPDLPRMPSGTWSAIEPGRERLPSHGGQLAAPDGTPRPVPLDGPSRRAGATLRDGGAGPATLSYEGTGAVLAPVLPLLPSDAPRAGSVTRLHDGSAAVQGPLGAPMEEGSPNDPFAPAGEAQPREGAADDSGAVGSTGPHETAPFGAGPHAFIPPGSSPYRPGGAGPTRPEGGALQFPPPRLPSISPSATLVPPPSDEAPRVPRPALRASDLAREILLVFPRDRAIALHASGHVLLQPADGFAFRVDLLRSMAYPAGYTSKVVTRRARGRVTDEPLGIPGAPVLELGGRGELVLAPPAGQALRPITLEAEALYLREDVVGGFAAIVSFENGRLGVGDGEAVGMVQLRGPGTVIACFPGDVAALEVSEARSTAVRGTAVLGWVGRVVPHALLPSEAPAGVRGFVAFAGEGMVLIDGR